MYINENVKNKGSFAVAVNLNFTHPQTSFAQYVANTVSHELAHTFGLIEGYFSRGDVPREQDANRGERPNGGTALIRDGGNAFPYDIMSAGGPTDKDLTFKKQTVQLLKAATGTADNTAFALIDGLDLWRNAFNLQNGRYPDKGHDMDGIREESANPSTAPEIFVVGGSDEFFGGGEETVLFGSITSDGPGSIFKDRSFILTNEGFGVLTIESVAMDGSAYSFVSNAFVGSSLAPGESTTFVLRFDPTQPGDSPGSLTIRSNAGSASVFQLNLTGQGITNTRSPPLSICWRITIWAEY